MIHSDTASIATTNGCHNNNNNDDKQQGTTRCFIDEHHQQQQHNNYDKSNNEKPAKQPDDGASSSEALSLWSTNSQADALENHHHHHDCCMYQEEESIATSPPSLKIQENIQTYPNVIPGAFAVDGIMSNNTSMQNDDDEYFDNVGNNNHNDHVVLNEQSSRIPDQQVAQVGCLSSLLMHDATTITTANASPLTAVLHPAEQRRQQSVPALLVEIVNEHQEEALSRIQQSDHNNKNNYSNHRTRQFTILALTGILLLVVAAAVTTTCTILKKLKQKSPTSTDPPSMSPPPPPFALLGWTSIANITGTTTTTTSNNKEYFGYSLSLSSDACRLAIGAPGYTNRPDNSSAGSSTSAATGQVRVYQRQSHNNDWSLLEGQPVLPSTTNSISFGTTVRLSRDGRRVAIASMAPSQGISRLHMFQDPAASEVVGTTASGNSTTQARNWTMLNLAIEYLNATGNYDLVVDLSFNGSIMVVGNPNVKKDRGQVRVYREVNNNSNSNQWDVMGTVIRGEFRGERCGKSVSISANGTRIAIGSVGSSNQLGSDGERRTGKVKLYDWDGVDWVLVGKIQGQHPQDEFGAAVSMSDDGNIVAIGAPGNNLHATAGMAQVYQYQGDSFKTWIQLGTSLVGSNTTDGLGFSISLSGDGNVLAVGLPGSTFFGTSTGSVAVYQYDKGTWTRHGSLLGGGFGSSGSFGYSVSVSGNGSRVVDGAPFASFEGGSPNDNIGMVQVFDMV